MVELPVSERHPAFRIRRMIELAAAGHEACSRNGNMLSEAMRIIARNVLVAFWTKHPETKAPLETLAQSDKSRALDVHV